MQNVKGSTREQVKTLFKAISESKRDGKFLLNILKRLGKLFVPLIMAVNIGQRIKTKIRPGYQVEGVRLKLVCKF